MKEQFQGCLLGTAVGDALGFPVKGLTADDIRAAHGEVRDYLDVPAVRSQPGELADEGQLMLLTLEGICTQRKLDLPDLVRRLKGWYRSHPKDMTPLTRHVLERLDAGERWEEASEGASLDSTYDPPDGGNLARCVPVALYHAGRIEKLVTDTTAVSRLTHWDNRAAEAAVALNFLITKLVVDHGRAFDELAKFLAHGHPDVRAAVEKTASSEHLDASGTALGALGVAVWAARTAKDFESGLVDVVALGGATDINAAAAGALLGARFGRTGIPQRWYYKLEGHARIEVLGSRVFEHAGM
jgi:ADP-ribosyl-[dinitrogen reductase] hydrolase